MSNRNNPRNGDERHTEHGPMWESHTSGAGCNSTHVAKSRAKWKRRGHRSERRTGERSSKVMNSSRGRGKPKPRPDE